MNTNDANQIAALATGQVYRRFGFPEGGMFELVSVNREDGWCVLADPQNHPMAIHASALLGERSPFLAYDAPITVRVIDNFSLPEPPRELEAGS